MNDSQTVNSGSHGIKWGLIIGVIYGILVYLRFRIGANNVFAFGGLVIASYVIILILLFYCGYNFRKENGGWAEMKVVFKTMLISVLIFEFIFTAVTFLYLKMIDPDFFLKLRNSTEEALIATKQSQSEIDKFLKNIDESHKQWKESGVFDFLRTYFTYLGISGLFALIFAFILKRKPSPFEQDKFLQS